jgi:hypothetical protein
MNYRIFKNIHGALALILLFGVALTGCKADMDDGSFVPKDPVMTVDADVINVSNQGGDYEVDLSSNLPWRAKTSANWLSLTSQQGMGDGVISFTVARNTTPNERSTVITAWITDDYEKVIQVVQEAGEEVDQNNEFFVKEGATGDGSSWANATSLDDALQRVEFHGDIIHIAAGTYAPTRTITGGNESDPRDNTFEINMNITLIGGYPANPTEGDETDPWVNESILSGQLDAGGFAIHVVTVATPRVEDQKVVFDGIHIKDGYADAAASNVNINGINYPRDHGGGIIIADAHVEMYNCNIAENSSGRHAAGMYVFSNSYLVMEDSYVQSNIGVNTNSNAAGLFLDGSTGVINNTYFLYNNAGGVTAGIMTLNASKIYLTNSLIAYNTSRTHGTGFYQRNNSTGYMINTLVYGNSNTGNGPGITAHDNASLTIINSSIVNNTTSGSGAGLYANAGTTFTVINSIVSGNTFSPASGDTDGPGVITFRHAVRGSDVYDDEESVIQGLVFNPETMLDYARDFVLYPVGANNPAITHGMTTQQLVLLGNTLNPAVGEEVITLDFLGESRAGATTMGAFVSVE